MKIPNKVIFCFYLLLVFFTILTINFINIAAANNEQVEIKTYSNATLEEDFANDRILVVLNRDSSFSYKTYTKNDFSDINCIKVEDLTSTTTEQVKREIINTTKSDISNLDNYRRVLNIQLEQKSKENVLEVIKKVSERDDIIYVGPDYRLSKFSLNVTLPDDTYKNNGQSKNWDYKMLGILLPDQKTF